MIGDQLHPRGRIDPYVYDLVGGVYAEVQAKEPWCASARPVTEIGVLTPEEWASASASNLPPAIKGVNRMGAGIVRSGNVIYFSSPMFTLYDKVAPLWCKRLLLNALDLLLPDPLLRHNGPSTLLAALNVQQAHNRYVLHLLHYIPERRGTSFDTLEDIIPL